VQRRQRRRTRDTADILRPNLPSQAISAARSRRARRIGVVVATAALGLCLAACSSGPSEGALQGKTAVAITSTSIQAYHRQQSVHYVTKTIVGKTTTIESGATSRSGSAEEAVTTNGHPVVEAVLVDHDAYLRATADFLKSALNLSSSTATTYGGKWISFQAGQTGYSSVVSSLSPTQAISVFVPQEPNLHVGGATSVAGHGAVAVVGSPGPGGQAAAGTTATTTLFVSTTAPYLPLSATTLTANNGSKKPFEQVASVFGKWNQKLNPIVPKGATPITTVTGTN
jgi:hypothetical protein